MPGTNSRLNRPMYRTRFATGAVLGLIVLAGHANSTSSLSGFHNGAYWVDVPNYASNDPWNDLQDTLTLTGTIRDFREWSQTGGHLDFESKPADGFGMYMEIVKDTLGEDGLPQFRSVGRKVHGQAMNGTGQAIIGPKPYIQQVAGDTPAVLASPGGQDQGGLSPSDHEGDYEEGAVFSEGTFDQWFRDVPGVNLTTSFPITLVREPGTNLFVFDDKDVSHFQSRGGFFPINGELYGNSPGESKNFHFTMHLSTDFLYKKGAEQIFRFIGDDDVWVFVDGKLVIDLGGIHAAEDMVIEMDRLTNLEHGKMYTLDFFFAERHRTQSNFRIETNLVMKRPVEVPRGSNLFD
ncbi:MAG: fibro-slime domain-containing protein [Phycisphaerales bacterium JB040]